jgi:hypothetical protein
LIDVNKWAKEAGLLVDATEMVEGLVSITSIIDINDSNQIVGEGYYRTWMSVDDWSGYLNHRVVFLLNPGMSQVPEPGATVAVVGVVALLAYAAMRRRQCGWRCVNGWSTRRQPVRGAHVSRVPCPASRRTRFGPIRLKSIQMVLRRFQ